MAAHGPRVSDADRIAWARQVAALAAEENDDEGTPEWRASVVETVNRRRAERGIEPLETQWWEHQPELELYRRARTLGLLRTVR